MLTSLMVLSNMPLLMLAPGEKSPFLKFVKAPQLYKPVAFLSAASWKRAVDVCGGHRVVRRR